MNTQAQAQDFEKLFRKELEKEPFEIPKENLTHLLPIWYKIMEVSSLEKLQCDVETHSSLIKGLRDNLFSLWQISFFINTLTRLSPMDLNETARSYNVICHNSNDLAKLWNAKVLPIREKLMKKLKTEAMLNAPKNGKFVNPNLRKR